MRSPRSVRRNSIPGAKPTGPIARDDGGVIINQEDRMIRMWPIGQDIRDFVVAIKDSFDGTQLGAVLVQRRLTATEDQRYPFVRGEQSWGRRRAPRSSRRSRSCL